MRKSDVVKIVIAVVIVGVGGWLMLRPSVDTEDYITAPGTAQSAPAEESAQRSAPDKKKKPAPPMTRVNEDIG